MGSRVRLSAFLPAFRLPDVRRTVLLTLLSGVIAVPMLCRADPTAEPSHSPEPSHPPRNCAESAVRVKPDPKLPIEAQESLLRQIVRVCPEMAEAHANLGAVLLKRGNYGEAKRSYEKAFAIHEDAAFLAGLGSVASAAGDTAEAENQYQRAVTLDPSSSAALQGMAYLHIRNNSFAEAEQFLRRAAQLTPEDPVLFFNFGVVLDKQGKEEEAMRSFRAALDRNPGYTEAREQLTRVLLRQSRFDEAETVLRSAIDQDNSDIIAAVMLASVLEARGNVKAAEKILSSLEKRLPSRVKDDPQVRLSRAVLRIKRGKSKDGLQQLRELDESPATRRDPAFHSRVTSALGWAYLQEGNTPKATELLGSVLRDNPENDVAKINLEVAKSLGN